MSTQISRVPTPVVFRTSPLYDIYGQTLYPYINHKLSGVTPYLTAFKKTIATINPFALQQVPTTDSVGLGYKFGERWNKPDPYPTTVTVDQTFPTHYDPLNNPRYSRPEGANAISIKPQLKLEFFPRHCIRSVDAFKTCLIANDDNKQKCSHEGEDILAVCPPWALDKIKDNQRLKLKLEAQANQTYKRVMIVPGYNSGRTVADVPQRTWENGERTRLRPNSIWADDIYVDITQKEVNEAKERVKRRDQVRGVEHDTSVHIHPYDRSYQAPSTKIPLYP